MKFLNAILLISIALMSNAFAFEFSSLKEIQALKSSVFGSNLIETISLTFQSDARAEAGKEVLAQLTELKTQLTNDQASDDALFNSKSTEFRTHIENLDAEIANLTEEINRLQAEIERLANLIDVANSNIASFEGRIANLEELLVTMANANNDDNKYYNQKIEELERLYQAFNQMIEKLNLLRGSVSGVNKYDHINATESELRDMAWSEAQNHHVDDAVQPPVDGLVQPPVDVAVEPPVEPVAESLPAVEPVAESLPAVEPVAESLPAVEPVAESLPAVEPVEAVAFIQKKGKKFLSFLQVANKETNKMALKLAKQYTKFLQLTLNADQAALEKLVSILSSIQDETLVKKSNTIEHLNDINARYAEMKQSSEEELQANRDSLARQIENRDKYVKEKQEDEEQKRNLEERRDLLVNEKAINERLLSELETTHKKESAERAEEMSIVDTLVRIVEKRLINH